MPPRVYRHRPWLAGTVVLLALTTALASPALHQAYRDPGLTSIATALVILIPLSAFAAYLVLSWRRRPSRPGCAAS